MTVPMAIVVTKGNDLNGINSGYFLVRGGSDRLNGPGNLLVSLVTNEAVTYADAARAFIARYWDLYELLALEKKDFLSVVEAELPNGDHVFSFYEGGNHGELATLESR